MKRKIEANDLYNFKYYSDSQISPDGNMILFVNTMPSKDENKNISHLYLFDGKNEKLISNNGSVNAYPKWLSCGTKALFVSDMDGKKQLYIFSLNNFTVEKLFDFSEPISFYSISSDNNMISFLSRKPIRPPMKQLEPREINVLQAKADEFKGFKDICHESHYFTYDIKNKEFYQLTPNGFMLEEPLWYSHSSPSWSNDNKKLVFSSRIENLEERDIHPWKSEIYTVNCDGSDFKKSTETTGVFLHPVFSHDDKSIYLKAHFNEYLRSTDLSLYKLDLETKEFTKLTATLDRPLDDLCGSDTSLGGGETKPVPTYDGKRIFFSASDCGSVRLMVLYIESGRVEVITESGRRVKGFSFDENYQKASIDFATKYNPSAISFLDINSHCETLVVNGNKGILDEIHIADVEDITYMSSDGIEQFGWIMKPVGFKKNTTYPAILEIHGGPYTFYGHAFTQEFQMLAAKGFCVMYCNPRGSKSYGQHLASAITDTFGNMDYDDMMRFVDKCVEIGYVDENRLGVTGGSYGGYMTNWIIAKSNRFKVAVTQRSISSWLAMYGMSDTGYISVEQMGILSNMKNILELMDVSPITYYKNINTPLLILHSEKDMRCPIDQGELLYVALKHDGKDVEMVRYPESGHGLSRNGIPSLREDRLNRIVNFMCKHIDFYYDDYIQ